MFALGSSFIILSVAKTRSNLLFHILTIAFYIIQKNRLCERYSSQLASSFIRAINPCISFVASLEILYRFKMLVHLITRLILCSKTAAPLIVLFALKRPFASSQHIFCDLLILSVFMWNIYKLINPIPKGAVQHIHKFYFACLGLLLYCMVLSRSWMIREHLILEITFGLLYFDMKTWRNNHKLMYNIRCDFLRLLGGSQAVVPQYTALISDIEEYRDRVGNQEPVTEDEEKFNCSICMDAPVDCVLLPCAHVVGCLDCINSLSDMICPICRRSVHQVSKLYFC